MISTHILDTSRGVAPSGVRVSLSKSDGLKYVKLMDSSTNSDGRIVFDVPREPGDYQLLFFTEEYFGALAQGGFFKNPSVEFSITDVSRKYHVPLLLNPFGYSTYRGT